MSNTKGNSNGNDNGDLEGMEITYGSLAKVVTAAIFVVGWTITIVAYLMSIKSELTVFKSEQLLINTSISNQITTLQNQQQENNRSIQDLSRILDKTNIYLEQLIKDQGKVASNPK